MKQVSYWHDTASAFTGAEPGPLPETTDVAVIGGGFTGLSAALALARRGASVVVLEADRVIGGASGRNGGHVNNGTSVDFGGLAERLGVDQARALYHAYDAAVDTVERIVQEEQITCSFRRGGKIKLAAKPAHYDKIARGFDLLHREADPETDLVPPERIRTEVGSNRFYGGLLYRKSAQMHMGQFGAGLATAAKRNGARIFENAAVTSLKRLSGGRHEVTTSRGSITAGQVLTVTGPSMRGPFFYFRRRVIPIGSFIIATEPLTDSQLDSIMPTRRTATTTLNIGNYLRRTGCRAPESMKACSTPWVTAVMAPRCRFTWDRKWPPLWPVMRKPIRCAAYPGPRCLVISGRHGSCRLWARTTGSGIWSAKHRPFAKLRPESPAPPRADPLSSPTAQETESRSAPHRI